MITRIKKMNPDYQALFSSRYPNDFKRKVVLYAEKHNNSEAERVFGIAESNVRRWRKIRPILFSKGFVADNVKKKRNVKKDFARFADKSVSSPKIKMTPSPHLSPNVPSSSSQNVAKDSDADEVCLRWNSHHSNMKSSFPTLLQREQYVDVTLTAEGKSLKCHKLILSSCSSYFDELLAGISPLQHPVIFLNGVSFWVLKCLIDFMYAGEVHIEQNKLESLLKVAEMLQIKGLTGKTNAEDEKLPAKMTPVKIEKQIPEERHTVTKKEDRNPPPPHLKREDRIIITKKEPSKVSPLRRVLSPTMITPIDPLSLLEPTFFEENPVPLKFKEHSVKKVLPKKIKKRKLSEQERKLQSPAPILYRKGTKSRPHVKVPRYYHNDYEDIDGKKLLKKEDTILSVSAPNITTIKKIKTEIVDIEEIDVQTDADKNKTKDINEKSRIIKKIIIPEKKIEMTIESDQSQSIENTSEIMTDPLLQEIKEEKIDEGYNEGSDRRDQNMTI